MRKRLLSIVSIFLLLGMLVSCNIGYTPASVTIKSYDRLELEIGDVLQLEIEESGFEVEWSASNDAVTVNQNGLVTAVREGKVAVTASCNGVSDSVMIEVVTEIADDPDENPPDNNGGSSNLGGESGDNGNGNNSDGSGNNGGAGEGGGNTDGNTDENTDENTGGNAGGNNSFDNSAYADSYAEALDRSQQGIPSGSTVVPDQAPNVSKYRPTKNGKYVLNSNLNFIDDNTYAVVDAYGNEVFRVYRGGGYITLEEVAAYLYAFGDVPANYVSGKKSEPENSKWGKYLRLNHSRFSGSTTKYPYEPKLPNISGCGGDLQYYEIDIGTTGTDCDPGYIVRTYNDGQTITRGAARIVYGKCDLDHDGVYEFGELHLFYTYNHYNDFQEYLNYYGGWGEMFGNVTGGGTLSSKSDYNPTPYVEVVREAISGTVKITLVYFYDPRKYFVFTA